MFYASVFHSWFNSFLGAVSIIVSAIARRQVLSPKVCKYTQGLIPKHSLLDLISIQPLSSLPSSTPGVQFQRITSKSHSQTFTSMPHKCNPRHSLDMYSPVSFPDICSHITFVIARRACDLSDVPQALAFSHPPQPHPVYTWTTGQLSFHFYHFRSTRSLCCLWLTPCWRCCGWQEGSCGWGEYPTACGALLSLFQQWWEFELAFWPSLQGLALCPSTHTRITETGLLDT